MSEKTALITGASRGIGGYLFRRFDNDGKIVFGVKVDVSDHAAVGRMVVFEKGKPKPCYIEGVIKGAKENALPQDYIDKDLKQW